MLTRGRSVCLLALRVIGVSVKVIGSTASHHIHVTSIFPMMEV